LEPPFIEPIGATGGDDRNVFSENSVLLGESLDQILERLSLPKEDNYNAALDESVRRLSNPFHRHKPHCSNDIGHAQHSSSKGKFRVNN
jgi:hypothetical protein